VTAAEDPSAAPAPEPAASAPAAPAEPAPPRWWHLRLLWLRDPAAARVYGWLAPALVTVLAAVLRLWDLARPHALVFDETYYVKDAWTLLHLGYEGTWPAGADAKFLAGHVEVFTADPSFVVHPPLGKWIIGLGMLPLGADSGWGWRIATALVGTAAVLLLIVVGRALTGSTTVGVLAGFLLAIDGLGIVMSRVALLDNSLMFFILLAFWFVLLDRERTRGRIVDSVAARAAGDRPVPWGPLLWNRPWVLAAGAALGAACAVKWSGVWVLAGLGIYLVVTDVLARRQAGVGFWATDGMLRQGPATFLLLVPVALAVYLLAWTGWLTTSGGYLRHGAESDPAHGFWSWVPLPLQSLWKYHEAMYSFHVGLTTPHAYASPAWTWPLLTRPTWMYWNLTQQGRGGCTSPGGCAESISSVPNPVIWFAGVAAVIYLVVRLIRRRDWQSAFVLTGVVVSYVPWLLFPERTIFQFYTIAILPFMLLAIALAARDLAGGGLSQVSDAALARAVAGRWVVLLFLVVAVAVSVFFYPVWTGMSVPYDFWRLHNWSPFWV